MAEVEDDPFADLQEVEDPFAATSQYGIDPNLTPEAIERMSELTDISSMLEGRDKGFFQNVGERVSQAALNMTTTDPMELADILTNRFPDDIDISLSSEGIPVATNKHKRDEIQRSLAAGEITQEEAATQLEDAQAVINRPGFSAMDVLQGIGMIGQYLPASKYAMGPLSAMKVGLTGEAKRAARRQAVRQTAGRSVVAETVTEAASQQAQELAGGEFDEGEVAFVALTAPIPEIVATPISNLARKTHRIMTDGVVIPEGIQKAIDYARATGRKIATSDVLAETIKAPRQIFLKAAERIPLIGTSAMKLRQAGERADTIEAMFNQMGLDASTDYGALIVNSFTRKNNQMVAGVNKLRSQAFEGMIGTGNVNLKSFPNRIAEELERAGKLEPNQKKQLTNYLQSLVEDFDGLGQFTFKDADIFLNSLYADPKRGLANSGILGEMQSRLAGALEKDMKNFALDHNVGAFNQWDLARKTTKKELSQIADDQLAKAISTGNINESIVDRVLDGGKNKDVTALWRNTDEAGHQLIKQRSFARIIQKSGGNLSDLETVNLDQLVKHMDKDPGFLRMQNEFWSQQDRDVMLGAKELLRFTAKSAKAFAAVGMLAGGQAGAGGKKMILGMISALFPPTQLIVAAARTHESDVVRDLLLKLRHAEPTSMAYQSILAELRPAVIAIGNEMMQEDRDPFAPEAPPTLFEQGLEATGRAGKQIYDAVTGFELPGMGESLDYLRETTGIGEEEE